MSEAEAAAVAQVVAAAEREFATYDVVFVGGEGELRVWDVVDPTGPQRVQFALTTKAFACDCRGFAVGGLGTCVHIEVVRLYLARRKAAKAGEQPAPATEPARATSRPAPIMLPVEPPSDLRIIAAQLERIAVGQERLVEALYQVASYLAPKAPNYRHTLAEWAGFDWGEIGAEVVKSDADGVAVVRWGGYLWTRRAPDNKFGEAVWYSRPEGKNADGSVNYVRLVTFQKPTETEPVGRKAQRAAEGR